MAVFGGRADVVDGTDLVPKHRRRRRGLGSVRVARITVGPTLPKASRGAGPRTPAITTFEIACAARVPTLRNHWRPGTVSISIATMISSERITVCR